MIHKPIDQIMKDDILTLIENEVREGKTLDYKLTLPGGSDSEKKEFLADVSSFANASGGDLCFGIKEVGGVPVEANGLADIDVDGQILRLESTVRDGIDPRVPGVQTRPIEGFDKGPILIVRIPQSWTSPHMVTFKGSSRFYSRNSAGKYPLDVGEIRSAFALSVAVPARIRHFRDARLAKIVADETPVRLINGPKMALHLVPLVASSVGFQLDPKALAAQSKNLFPIRGSAEWRRYNADGYVCGSEPDEEVARQSTGYCQAFRNGAIESVACESIAAYDGRKTIPGFAYERDLMNAACRHLDALRQMEVPLPIVVMLSLIEYAGYEMGVPPHIEKYGATPIDRDVVLLPDVLVEDYEVDVATLLRPSFDGVWNAAGWAGSINYDDDGKWKSRQ